MERANSLGNPGFLRLADLATAFAGPNGHAEFVHGELARFLAAKDYRAVDKAIADAVRYHLLADGSHKRCLQIPLNVFQPYAGTSGQSDMDERRSRPCVTCIPDAPVKPALCGHPERERYTAVKNGGLCESCYRLSRKAQQETRTDTPPFPTGNPHACYAFPVGKPA